MAVQRERVTSPFVEGARPKYRGLEVSQRAVARPVAPVKDTSTTDMISSLVSLAGSGSQELTKYWSNKAQEDKVVQTSRALQGMVPTTDATVAGYKAHAVVSIQAKNERAKKELAAFASTNPSDEAWEAKLAETYQAMSDAVQVEYQEYGGGSEDVTKELSSLVTLSMSSNLPALTSLREATRLEYEKNGRIESATDYLIQGANQANNPEFQEGFLKRMQLLQLTQDEQDNVILKATGATKNQNLVDMTKTYKGGRDTTLFERTGSLQELQKKMTKEQLSNDAINLGMESGMMIDDYLSGKMTDKQFVDSVNMRNKQTMGMFMTKAAVNSAYLKRQKVIAAETRSTNLMAQIANPNVFYIPDAKPKEIDQALMDMYQSKVTQAFSDINAQTELEPMEKSKKGAAAVNMAVKAMGALSVKMGRPMPMITSAMQYFANLNVPNSVLTQTDGEFEKEFLTAGATQSMDFMYALEPVDRESYFDSMKQSDADTLRNFMTFRESGVRLPQALYMAQQESKFPKPKPTKNLVEAANSVMSEVDGYFSGVPENSKQIISQHMMTQLSKFADPNSKLAQETVTAIFDKKYTDIGNDFRVRGTPSEISRLTNLNINQVGIGVKGAIDAMMPTVLPYLSGTEFDQDDIYPDFNPVNGTIQLKAPDGRYLGRPIPMSKLPQYHLQYKDKIEKEAAKSFDRFSKKGGTGWSLIR